MKLSMLLMCGVCVTQVATCAQPEVKELAIDPGNLEGLWRFSTDPDQQGEARGWAAPDFDDSGWREISVPGYWEAQGVTEGADRAIAIPGVQYTAYDGIAWYRLRFSVPTDWVDVPLVLYLGGVDDRERVFVNGRFVGAVRADLEHPSTVSRQYTVPAELITSPGENVIAIEVTDGGGPGGIHRGPVGLVPEDAMERIATAMPNHDAPLEERFANPPADRRILPIVHGLPTNTEEHEAFLFSLMARGFGGMVTNVPFQDYLQSDEMWEVLEHAVRRAKDLGLAVWLYDEEGYPSGTAGGQVLIDRPEWRAHGLLIAVAHTTGEAVDLPLPEGELVRAVACPLVDGAVSLTGAVDLSPSVQAGRITWTPEPGAWRVFGFVDAEIYEGTHATQNVFRKQHYINIMDPAPVRRYIEMTHEEYLRRLPDMADLFESTFTDEPSLMSVFLAPQPWAVLPWVHDLEESFSAAKGYSLVEALPALAGDVGAEGHRVRCDFWEHVGQRVADAYFGQIQDWCREVGIPSGGHLIWEEDLGGHCGFYGDFYRCAERLDYPSIDCLTSIPGQVPWHIAKLLGSIAHLHGAPQVMSETSDHAQRYRPAGDDRPPVKVTPADIRGTCNRLYVAGVNTTTSYYSFDGLDTADLRTLNEYVGRMGTMLTGGEAIADIAVLYPIESVWASMRPAAQGATGGPEVREIDRAYRDAQTRLFENRRDFEILNSNAIAGGSATEGTLSCGPLQFQVALLPGASTVNAEAWERVGELYDSGGIVVLTSAIPQHSMALRDDPSVLAVSQRVLGVDDVAALARAGEVRVHTGAGGGVGVYIPPSMEPALPRLLDGLLAPDVTVSPSPSPVRHAHRRQDGHEVYYLINDSPEPIEAAVTFAASGGARLWDTETGAITELAAMGHPDGRSEATLSIGGYSSCFVTFERALDRPRLAGADAGAVGITARPLEEIVGGAMSWSPSGAGHVTMSALGRQSYEGVDNATLIDATINTGGIDSHCFAHLAPAPSGLEGVDALRLTTYVPEGQTANAELLVIVAEASGATYVGSTHRALSRAGWQSTVIWLDSLDIGGWSSDANGRLDLDQVRGLAVGWGGYFGKDDETVRFAMGKVEALSLLAPGE